MIYDEQSFFLEKQYMSSASSDPYLGHTDESRSLTALNYQFLKHLLIWLSLICAVGCTTVNSYSGPDLPDDKVATISMKAPPTAYVPIFWMFPLNMLNWLADDWFETSWTSATITVNNIQLDRFTSVKVLPGTGTVKLNQSFFIDQRSDGPTRCSPDSCKCTETQVNGTTKRECEQKCETPMATITHERHCEISLDTDRGQKYEAFIRNEYLKVYDVSKDRIIAADCRLSPEIKTRFTKVTAGYCSR